MNLIESLLTEDRYWSFFKSDCSESRNVEWNGKTRFSDVIKNIKKELGEDIVYERQVEIKKPDFVFE